MLHAAHRNTLYFSTQGDARDFVIIWMTCPLFLFLLYSSIYFSTLYLFWKTILAPLLFANRHRHKKYEHPSERKQVLHKSVNKLWGFYELVAVVTVICFSSEAHHEVCSLIFTSCPLEGANAPFCAVFLSSSFLIMKKQEKLSGILWGTFSGRYGCSRLL